MHKLLCSSPPVPPSPLFYHVPAAHPLGLHGTPPPPPSEGHGAPAWPRDHPPPPHPLRSCRGTITRKVCSPRTDPELVPTPESYRRSLCAGTEIEVFHDVDHNLVWLYHNGHPLPVLNLRRQGAQRGLMWFTCYFMKPGYSVQLVA